MIDTDKYEGHQVSEFKTSVAGPKHSWVTHRHTAGAKDAMFVNHATAALVADAPELLDMVKAAHAYSDYVMSGFEEEVEGTGQTYVESGWEPVCFMEFYDNEWQIMKEAEE
tara:strand:- start:649 stop:981 length:333 start_codon:yes stop_codon:yes gene_type:complete